MKKVIGLFLVLSLDGCGQYDAIDIKKAVDACKALNGEFAYKKSFTDDKINKVYCSVDGIMYEFNRFSVRYDNATAH